VENDVFSALMAKAREEPFAKKMGLRVLEVSRGYSRVAMTLTPEMENIFAMTHGGAIFSLIDEAFEMASNSHGTAAVALNMNVTYITAPRQGDTLQAEARESSKTRKTAHYAITVHNGGGDLIATCSALVYRKDQPLSFL